MQAQLQALIAGVQPPTPIINVQPATAAPAAAAPAAPTRIKTNLPTTFDSKSNKVKSFVDECNNYFTLNPMTEEQRIHFSLQCMGSDAQQWKRHQLSLLSQWPLATHLPMWVLFVAEFNTHFIDTQEMLKAAHNLLTSKLIQTTSAHLFIDQVQEKCDTARWNTDPLCIEVIQGGLKEEVSKGIAHLVNPMLPVLINTAIAVDENLQCLKGKTGGNCKTTTKKEAATSTPWPNNSKYKLSEEGRKEHMDNNLCFKCHKKGHSSKECKGQCAIYSEVKAKTKIAKVNTKEKKEDDKGKTQVAKVTVKDKKEEGSEEDFADSN